MMLSMLVLAGVCWVFRVFFILVVPAERLPATGRRALGNLAPAVLAALVAVEADAAARGGSPLVAGYVLVSVLVVGLVAFRTRSLIWSISISAAACLLLDLVLLG
jgi:branched-subunit amino acid transport protein